MRSPVITRSLGVVGVPHDEAGGRPWLQQGRIRGAHERQQQEIDTAYAIPNLFNERQSS